MEYRRFGDKIVARLDKGEEICSTLLDLAGREGIRLASVSGIGASNNITLGVFRTKKKEYVQNRYYGIDYELASVTGNLSMKDGQPYLHLHAVIGNPSLKSAYLSLDEREPGICFGGHLNSAVVSATCEIIIDIIDGEAGRKFSEEIGLNLFEF